MLKSHTDFIMQIPITVTIQFHLFLLTVTITILFCTFCSATSDTRQQNKIGKTTVNKAIA